MILIISDSDDLSTDYVLDYLKLYNASYVRVNFIDIIDNFSTMHFNLEHAILKINGQSVNLNDIKAVWLRKIGFLKRSEYYKSYQQAFQSFPAKDILEFISPVNCMVL
jgi:hypothetical protein